MGIVVLDHLRRKCPLQSSEVQSDRGEIKGARSALSTILEKYGIPAKYLKEVTTRAGHQDGQRLFEALRYGENLATEADEARERHIVAAIAVLVDLARRWLARQHLKINCDRGKTPAAWIGSILNEAKGKSGGKVEQHLIGAKLEERHPDQQIENNPGHAGDVQTGRAGDFTVGSTVYHVTASPGSSVVQKCEENLGGGLHPFLLVPRDQVAKARHIAEDRGVLDRVTIMAIEDFIASNIVEMSKGKQQEFIGVLKSIIGRYNRRLKEVESDMSLKIEVD